jgi:hypothetical protein
VTLLLKGPAGGRWILASGPGGALELEMSVEDFMRHSSGRIGLPTTLQRVSSNAGEEGTRRVLEHLLAPY